MQAIKAVYDGNNFMPRQPIPVSGRCEVIITFLEPEKVEPSRTNSLRGLFAGDPNMTVDRFLERKRADKEFLMKLGD